MSIRPTFLGLVTVLLAPAVAGQLRFAEFKKDSMPNAPAVTAAVAIGDLDGDGRPDLVFGNRESGPRQAQAFRNVGNGTFEDMTASWMPAFNEWTNDLVIADLDGDGDNDLVLANPKEQSRIYLNDGTGVMVDASANLGTLKEEMRAVEVFDADGDNDLDIVFALDRFGARLYENDGNAVFSPVVGAFSTSLISFVDVAAGDVDGDGDLDLVGTTRSPRPVENKLFLNDGSGVFTEVSHGPFAAASFSDGVALGDIDADGDLDVVFASAYTQNQLYRNDGSSNFTEITATHMPPDNDVSLSVQFGDVDGDNDLDIVFGNDEADTVYLNDGAGVFADASTTLMDAAVAGTSGIALGDLDGDGDLDAALGIGRYLYNGRNSTFWGNNVVLYNEGGVFHDSSQTLFPAGGISGEVADLNGDGTPDVVRVAQDELSIMFGRRGYRIGKTIVIPITASLPKFRVVDVDADNDLDILVSNFSFSAGVPVLLLNSGSGNFVDATATNMPASFPANLNVAAGDIDGDGDVDAVFCTDLGAATLLNDGSGVFTSGPTIAGLGRGLAIDLADVDGDNDLDVALGYEVFSPNSGVQLFANDGSANFVLGATLEPRWRTDFVLFDDVDNDGAPDLWTEGPRLYVNDGTGTFIRRVLPTAFNRSNAGVRTGDLDGDGDGDVVLWGFQQFLEVWENDGSGFYTINPTTGLGTAKAGLITLADLDVDGDVDVLFAPQPVGTPPARLLQNVRQHLSAPNMAKLGQGYQLTIHAQDGLATMLFLDVQLTPTPLTTPFGTLQLDLGTALQTPVLTMTGSTLDLNLVMPVVPALAGFVLYSQAIVVSEGLGFRWTNLIGDFIFS